MSTECTIYRDVNFTGARLPLTKELSHLDQHGFNDAASSAKVSGTPWIFYKDINFMGTSYVVKPGSYPNPASWGGENDVLSSLRPLPSATQGPGVIVLFEHNNYCGNKIVCTSSTPDFSKIGFNDKVSSLIVIKGIWTGLQDINYEGANLGTYTTGTYLPALAPNNTMSSIRLAD